MLHGLRKKLIWKLLLPVPILAIVFVALAWIFVPRLIIDTARHSSVASAVQTANQFKKIRGYYTSNVIAKVVADGNLKPSYNHAAEQNGIPLPATFIHDVSKLLAEEETSINLFSDYPFPLRRDRKLDGFQRDAWTSLNENPDSVFTREETRNGRRLIRVAVADKMVAEACVSCHNSHAESPKVDWQLNDVRGVLEIASFMDDEYQAAYAAGNTIVFGAALACLALVAFLFVSARMIAQPLRTMTEVMRKLASGNQEVEVPARDRTDEIGQIADAVQVFKDNAVEMERLQLERAEAERTAEQSRQAAIRELADDFETSIKGIVETVSAASAELQLTAESMTGTADQTKERAVAVASASEQASTNVQTVATAAEELSHSIQEIARQVVESANIAGGAVEQTAKTNNQVEGLVAAASKVGEVVSLISEIAEQTNLLALNATIEAARAGDMGKGFAVVASEVKHLANQTARATEEIGQHVTGIQSATTEAAEAIRAIGKTVGSISEIAAAISAAVEQQGAATEEITRNVQEAWAGTQRVSDNIGGVTQAAGETGESAKLTRAASDELARQSKVLSEQVDQFLKNVRTG